MTDSMMGGIVMSNPEQTIGMSVMGFLKIGTLEMVELEINKLTMLQVE